MKTIEDIKERKLIKECVFKTARSGGAGGQNVNKVESKVELWFNISESELLTEDEKELLLKKLNKKLEKETTIHLQEQTDRTQLKNKELLKEKFYKLILSGFKVAKVRKPTKVSKAAKAKRLDSKKIKGEIKQLRRKII
ncbi:MAG: Class peptide chain release factor [Bacteroidetes bacterium]|jgi:ribosome-associated protein|nr:Class peptide chain release factor [Bacteroidota bacterium]